MKKFIVACGSGVATSQTVASTIGRMFEKDKVPATVEAVDMKALDNYIKDADGYIYIAKPKKEYPIPTFNGIAFLTGMGKDAEYKKILDFINK
ncbi:PTS sugar transporter subunit IIB [Streptococcus pluranimalium]|uniref:PTS sugar transporter subunit IIB n=1 Tax=Streptococcus pluranimalium TaxID=82348 RepID=UPI0039ED607C